MTSTHPEPAVLFDMDGLLIDSEPLWQDAEIEVFGEVGLELTRDLCRQTMGLRIDEVVHAWYERHPWHGPTLDEVRDRIVDRLMQLVRSRGVPMPGAIDTVARVRDRGVPCGIASSSSVRIIDGVLERLGLTGSFDVVHSAENERYGKPHPGVFLTTASLLGVQPDRCLVLEDSINGLVAAKAARMRCLMVPDVSLRGDERLALADAVFETLEDVDDTVLDRMLI